MASWGYIRFGPELKAVFNPVTPVVFGNIHGLIGAIDKRIEGVSILVGAGYAQTDRNVDNNIFGKIHECFGNGLSQTFCHVQPGCEVGIGQQDDDFLATIAPDQISIPHTFFALQGELTQDLISGFMTVGIVDAFEVIDIYHDGGEFFIDSFRLVEGDLSHVQ